MRKYISMFLIALFVFLGFSSKPMNVNAAEYPKITMTGTVLEDNQIRVVASLTKNPGILSANLKLDYDEENITFIDFNMGDALKSLDPITTCGDVADTEERVTYYNSLRNKNDSTVQNGFFFNYSGEENDYSTGILFTLYFKINKHPVAKNYSITLTYEKDKEVSVIENEQIKITQILIDPFEFKIDSSGDVSPVEDFPVIAIVGISIGGAGAVLYGVYAIQKILKKRKLKALNKWKKVV